MRIFTVKYQQRSNKDKDIFKSFKFKADYFIQKMKKYMVVQCTGKRTVEILSLIQVKDNPAKTSSAVLSQPTAVLFIIYQ